MSYILDALKKAERERGIAQVPTLSTIHATEVERQGRRVWFVALICIAFAVIIVSAGFWLLKTTGSRVSPAGKIENAQKPEQPATSAGVPSPASSKASAPAEVSVHPTQSVAANDVSVKKPSKEERAAEPRETSRQPEMKAPIPPAPVQPRPAQSGSAPVAPAPLAAPAPENSQQNSASLRDSAAKMKITILMYSETKSERMVFINDRKYREGDVVDGRYLLESITPEGAVLSYQGERLTIHPITK